MTFVPDSLYSWQIANSSTPQPIMLLNHFAFQCEGLPTDPPIIFRLPVTAGRGWTENVVGTPTFTYRSGQEVLF